MYNFDHGKELSGVLMASTSRTKHTESIKMRTFFKIECLSTRELFEVL